VSVRGVGLSLILRNRDEFSSLSVSSARSAASRSTTHFSGKRARTFCNSARQQAPRGSISTRPKAGYAETVLPSVGGNEHAQAHIAQVMADRSGEGVSLALGMLAAELDQFMKSHAVAIQ
jgi:hypothetical protein